MKSLPKLHYAPWEMIKSADRSSVTFSIDDDAKIEIATDSFDKMEDSEEIKGRIKRMINWMIRKDLGDAFNFMVPWVPFQSRARDWTTRRRFWMQDYKSPMTISSGDLRE